MVVVDQVAVVTVAPLAPPSKLWEVLSNFAKNGPPIQGVESISEIDFKEDFVLAAISSAPLSEGMDCDFGPKWRAASDLERPENATSVVFGSVAQTLGREAAENFANGDRPHTAVLLFRSKKLSSSKVWSKTLGDGSLGKEQSHTSQLLNHSGSISWPESIQKVLSAEA